MYGRGNYAPPPQFGQGLPRPMPPYLQQPAGNPSASHFQPGISMPVQPVNQQSGPPHGVPPRAPAYPHPHPHPGPPSMPHQGPPASTSNTGQQYMRPPHNGAPSQPSYLTVHQNFVSGSQNPQLPLPPPPPPLQFMDPSRAPPPPPSMQLPPPPPPPPQAGADVFPPPKQQSADSRLSAAAPPPLPPSSPPSAPPPPSSCSSFSPGRLPTPTNTAPRSPTQLGHDSTSELGLVSESNSNVLLDLPPPPPKPVNENIVRNIEVLCQFIAKNGPEFEEMARKNESGNPELNFLVDGDPGSEASCAREYFVWMKKKCGLENVLQKGQGQKDLPQSHVDASNAPHLLPNEGRAHPTTDSDVDMEDDITHSDKEYGVYNSTKDVELEPVVAGDSCERQKHENENVNEKDLQYSKDNSPAPKLSPSVKFQAGTETKAEISVGQPSNIQSPFRLIQNYASDDSSDDEHVKEMVASPLGKSGASSLLDDDMVHGNSNLKSSITSETGLAQSATGFLEKVSTKGDDLQPVQGCNQDVPAKVLPEKAENNDREGGAEGSNPNAAFDGKYASGSSGVDSVSTCKDVEKEIKRNTSAAVKVDEFGRLAKNGASESESDDAQHLRRRGRRDWSHSRSRSRSPSDRRKRRSPRRSPRRRKERRSRSRSWSPKKRRSRSRSPQRSGGDFRGEKLRRGMAQSRECFDFLKGRCYRGASCRYLHHETDKNENFRRYSSNHDFHGGSVTLKSPRGHNRVKDEKLHLDLETNDNRDLALQTCNETRKAEIIDVAVLPSVSHQDAENLVTDVKVCADSKEAVWVTGAADESISHLPICGEHPSSGLLPNEQGVHHPPTEVSAGAHDRPDREVQKVDESLNSDSTTIHVSAPNASASDFPHQVSHLPPPPPLPQQATNVPRVPNLQVDYNLLAPSVCAPSQSVPAESGPLYQAPLPNQQSHYSVPSNPAWSTLPQPRPQHMVGPPMPSTPLQFQQGSFPVRNDFPGQMPLRVHPGELQSHSQAGGFPHQTYHMPPSSIPAQPFAGGQNLVRDDRYSQFPIQSHVPSSSFAPGVSPQPVTFQGDSTVKNTQSFPGDNQFPQQRLLPFGPQLTASEGISSHIGGSVSRPGYSSNPLDRDNSSNFFDVGGSRISTHYNPYASTFDQPLSTRFSSIAFTQERDAAAGIKYDSSFGLSHGPIDGQTAGDQGSRQIISSSNSSKAGGQTLPKSGGDQYDPLFDSMGPYSESFEKHAPKQDHAADNSDIMLKLSSRHNVLDVEENNKQKVVGAVAATASLENDEFGETADAEVGAVENESPSSNNNDDTDIADGDIEIDQVRPEGKSKKSKDSRSMKLFKVAVANFVKEVLKPQWRQGNMSKEVFKTIVKKTVDKVSGAMKNHRVPKSQAKIDHYIESSRRKLTQLVEGYVSKYKS